MASKIKTSEKLLLRIDEAAAQLSLSRSMLYLMSERGELPTVRVGRRGVRFSQEGLREWVRAREVRRRPGHAGAVSAEARA